MSDPTYSSEKTTSKDISRLVKKRTKNKGTTTIYSLSYKLLSKRIGFLYPHFSELKLNLQHSGIPVIFEAYISTMVFLSWIAVAIGVGIGFVISLSIQTDTPNMIIQLFPVLFGFFSGLITFVLIFQYPKNEMLKRKSKISEEMAYFSGYMGTLAASGLTLEGVYKTIAFENTHEELVKDAKYLTRNIEFMGLDIMSAILDLIERSPVATYSEFLEGIVSNLKTGGSLKEYFIATGEIQLEQRKRRLQEANQSLGVVTELFTMLLVVFPLLGAIMLSIMGMMSVELFGFSLTAMLSFLTYGFVPLLGLIMILMIDSLIPKR